MGYPYELSTVSGTIYSRGTPLFFPSRDTTANASSSILFSIVGNRLSAIDCVRGHTRVVASFSARSNIDKIAVSASRNLVFVADVHGHCSLIFMPSGAEFPSSGAPFPAVLISQFSHAPQVNAASFSPDGNILAIAQGRSVHLWALPSNDRLLFEREFAPLQRQYVLTGFSGDVSCVSFSECGRFVAAGGADCSVRVCPVLNSAKMGKGKRSTQHRVLVGHKSVVVGVFFDTKSSERVYSVSRDGTLLLWDYERGSYTVKSRYYFNRASTFVTSCDFSPVNRVLSVGFSDGVFGVYDLSMLANGMAAAPVVLSLLSAVGEHDTAGPCFVSCSRPKGEWISVGIPHLGCIFVWEYGSETFVFKQRSHPLHSVSCGAFSLDGTLLATGDESGEVKVFSPYTGFCITSFASHETNVSGGKVAAVCWSSSNALFAAGADGVIRAFDPLRYREFRRFESPHKTQFTSIDVDPSGELIVAGGQSPTASAEEAFLAYVWEIRTGRLVESLAGHQSIVTDVKFSPKGDQVATCSLDKTVRIHKLASDTRETLDHTKEVLSIAWRPDGKYIASTCLGGFIQVWDVEKSELLANVEGTRDIPTGKLRGDRKMNHAFDSIAYSTDGNSVVAGGRCNYVCVYAIHGPEQPTLLRRYTLSSNRSIDGVVHKLNSKRDISGISDGFDVYDEDDVRNDLKRDLEGARGLNTGMHGKKVTGVFSHLNDEKKKRGIMRTRAILVSPAGDSFAAVTVEGILMYSQEAYVVFDPLSLELGLTPDMARLALEQGFFGKALLMSLRLSIPELVNEVMDRIPASQLRFCLSQIPTKFAVELLPQISRRITEQNVVVPMEKLLVWTSSLFDSHGRLFHAMMMRDREDFIARVQPKVRELLRAAMRVRGDICSLTDSNKYSLRFISDARKRTQSESETLKLE
eukprot:ANDGO_03971.mRNA.1 Periodic tryptophan protein 2 homolog